MSEQNSLPPQEQETFEETEKIEGIVDLLLSKYFTKVENEDDGGKCRFCKKPNLMLYKKNGHSNLVKHLKVKINNI